ncbi:Gfo/Idh/MocA family protein [Streptomyces sp. NPDC057780]|uniref:Gfo/Idh/MocA family protein n=2 Tax=unclassified Streptomyces TaxID=2593676 RepID=UPI0036BDEC1B
MRVGVVGLRMGLHLADWCRKVGMEVVAACDRDPERRAVARARFPGAVLVERWQELLEHRLDGVVLANDFDEHAPLAIAFLDRGMHVLSESAACVDAAEGERLIAAADRSSATYSFAENYVVHPHVRLIRQAIEAGGLGRISLIEADYLHGMSPAEAAGLIGDPAHWRGRIAPTAYCTHTLSPVLALTDAWPVGVSAVSPCQNGGLGNPGGPRTRGGTHPSDLHPRRGTCGTRGRGHHTSTARLPGHDGARRAAAGTGTACRGRVTGRCGRRGVTGRRFPPGPGTRDDGRPTKAHGPGRPWHP